MAYLLDANVFIQAKNLHYGFDFCPAFWDWLVERNAAGSVVSIDRIGGELHAGADDLADWAAERGHSFFVPIDAGTLTAFNTVAAWLTGQSYEPAAVNGFLQVADSFLVAHALAYGHVVVTHEIPAASIKRVKIPNACAGVGVRFITPFDMLRIERARFVLGQ